MTLEEAHEGSATKLPAIRASLEPMRRILARRPCLASENPAYADYIVYGAFKWYQLCSGTVLTDAEDSVSAWFDRIDRICGAHRDESFVKSPGG